MEPCHINLKDVYRYLGFHKQEPDEKTKEQIAEMSKKLESASGIKGTYRIFPLSFENGLEIQGTTLELSGKDIHTLLKESHHCILMAMTLGHEVDRWIRETQIKDMTLAVILDACASSLVEEYCNQLEADIKKEYKNQFFTDRFSAGYGDLPITLQNSFCQVLDTNKKIGLSVSSTHIMTPKKSITAIIGIADTAQPMRIKGCAYCSMVKNCAFRKGGNTCGSSTT